MLVIIVNCHVRLECVDLFRQATIENAQNSIKEPGIARFDVLQELDDPTRFTLVEAYRTPEDPPKHRETAHYKTWRDAVAEMFVEPRTRSVNNNVYPDDNDWD